MKNYTLIYLFIFSIISLPVLSAKLDHKNFNLSQSVWYSMEKSKARNFLLCKIENPNRDRKHVHKVKVHFDNNVDSLDEKAKNILDEAMRGYYVRKSTKIELQGHADILGSDASNMDLSMRRNKSVTQFLVKHRKMRSGTRIALRPNGEKYSNRHHRSDRYVEVRFINKTSPRFNLKKVILIDGSLSMLRNTTYSGLPWYRVKKMQFPKDAIVYVVRAGYARCLGNKLAQYYPKGETYIKEAMGLIAYYLKGKATVEVFSDGVEELSQKSERVIKGYIKKSKRSNRVRWLYR